MDAMDSILSAFSNIGFLLRSVFAGAFFVVSYYVATHARLEPEKIEPSSLLSVAFPVALFVGVTAYGIHRSLVFPIIEACFDLNGCINWRAKNGRLILKSTVEKLLDRWKRAVEDKQKTDSELAKRLTVWADYTQLQYVSALCVVLGAFAGKVVTPGPHPPHGPLVWATIILLLAALISDWRLRAVDEHISKQINAAGTPQADVDRA